MEYTENLCGQKNKASVTFFVASQVFILKTEMKMMKTAGNKNEFVRLRIDKVEKKRLDKICSMTRRQRSDIIRESLFDLYKLKFPECLVE